ncbi:MAG: ankyrin repeat domain-containing protein [Marinovum sp.]|nr:ankyrin repeat domain-containing protein [Marinovum sp.]
MDTSLDQLRRDATKFRKSHRAGDLGARARATAMLGPKQPQSHVDFLYIIARERGFASWPRLKTAAETRGLNQAERDAHLRRALYLGQVPVLEHLLAEDPNLGEDAFEINIALYRCEAVARALAENANLATQDFYGRRPILHLAFSKYLRYQPEAVADMLAVAQMLFDAGADVNDGFPHEPGSDHFLSALYGAIGHGNNMRLGQWLLDHGANPNDGESLYHATELGHHDGLKMLIAAGADPKGTNALLRAMDFDDVEAVRMLIEAGGEVGDFKDDEVGGEAPWVARSCFQVARRGCSEEMARLVVRPGPEVNQRHNGALPYAFARVHGHGVLADLLANAGADTTMTDIERHLASAVTGPVKEGALTGFDLGEAYNDMVREILQLPERKGHVERLLALGLDIDRPDAFGITPLHAAGWQGLPEMMGLLKDRGADLDYINGYGGTLLSTVLHGSENNPSQNRSDYVGAITQVFEWGAPLPRIYIDTCGREDLMAWLADFAEAHPDRVV